MYIHSDCLYINIIHITHTHILYIYLKMMPSFPPIVTDSDFMVSLIIVKRLKRITIQNRTADFQQDGWLLSKLDEQGQSRKLVHPGVNGSPSKKGFGRVSSKPPSPNTQVQQPTLFPYSSSKREATLLLRHLLLLPNALRTPRAA